MFICGEQYDAAFGRRDAGHAKGREARPVGGGSRSADLLQAYIALLEKCNSLTRVLLILNKNCISLKR